MADTEGWKISVQSDNSSAKLLLAPPSDGIAYTVEDVTIYLRQNGVSAGIIFSAIENMIRGGVYYKDVVVATWRKPVDGVDGYYEYFFQKSQIKHPTIRSDGSVDYSSMSVIHSVHKDDLLAVYHPAIPGSHGVDVRGRELRCKPGKDQPELRGLGFSTSLNPDGTTNYVATIEGRVESDKGKLYVRDVYEHRGDLDLITGTIDFLGDVIIHGSVRAGTTVRASKSITVEGNVEAAVLVAEGDIVLKKGMQGGRRARLVAGGDIYAYFLEYTDVSAKGNVEANIILNCRVNAGKAITVKGTKGYVVGGSYNATSLVSSTNIGNNAGVKTVVGVGITDDLESRNQLLMTKYETAKRGIESAKSSISVLADIRLNKDPRDVREAKINKLKRQIKRDERLMKHIEKELDELKERMADAKGARIRAEGMIFQGVIVKIDDKQLWIDRMASHVEYYRPSAGDDIRTRTSLG